MKIDNFGILAYVDLLANVNLQNNWLVEFSDLKYKSSSNFKSIGWKMKILVIWKICCPFDLKNNWLVNSVTKNINPLQIWSQSVEKWGFLKYHLSCWSWTYVDLLATVDLKNNFLVEFSDLKYKYSSNIKSTGWKLRNLEISPKLLTFSRL